MRGVDQEALHNLGEPGRLRGGDDVPTHHLDLHAGELSLELRNDLPREPHQRNRPERWLAPIRHDLPHDPQQGLRTRDGLATVLHGTSRPEGTFERGEARTHGPEAARQLRGRCGEDPSDGLQHAHALRAHELHVLLDDREGHAEIARQARADAADGREVRVEIQLACQVRDVDLGGTCVEGQRDETHELLRHERPPQTRVRAGGVRRSNRVAVRRFGDDEDGRVGPRKPAEVCHGLVHRSAHLRDHDGRLGHHVGPTRHEVVGLQRVAENRLQRRTLHGHGDEVVGGTWGNARVPAGGRGERQLDLGQTHQTVVVGLDRNPLRDHGVSLCHPTATKRTTAPLTPVVGQSGMIARLMLKRAAAIAIGLVLSGGAAACASIWGFEDGVLGSDAGLPDGKTGSEGGRRDVGKPRDGGTDVQDSTIGRDSGADVRDSATATDSAIDVHTDASNPCALTCVPGVPLGWSGPYVISETTGGPPAPAPAGCADSYSSEAYSGYASPHAPAATCSCRCGPAEGGTCAPPTVTLYNDPTCDSPSECDSVDASAGACVTFSASCTGTYMIVGTPHALPGRCRATGTADVPDAGWTASVRLCGPADASAAACSGGKVCVPPVPDAGFESTYCVVNAGGEPVACPPGPYSHQRVYYGGATDDRGCSACVCGAPDASCSGGTYTTHKKAGCGSNSTPFSTPQSCVSVGGDKSGIYNGSAVLTSGACVPDGGVATGSFTPTTPTTICCTE